jgi:hypothetical protein
MRFSIRDVLWLTVVVALVVGWGVDRMRWQTGFSKLREELHDTRSERTQRWINMKQLERILEAKGIQLPPDYLDIEPAKRIDN